MPISLTSLGKSAQLGLGARPLWEEPDKFADYMVNTVLTKTTGTTHA